MQTFLPSTSGISLKPKHYKLILETEPKVGWFEVHPENYMGNGGAPHKYLTEIRSLYPLSMHGVGMSLGSATKINEDHLNALCKLVKRYQPQMISEHLSWSRLGNTYLNDLLPLPYTDESLKVIVNNIDRTQTTLGRKILIENPSIYLAFNNSTYSEPEFLNNLVEQSGCGLLLDVNNIFVSACNQGFDPYNYIRKIKTEAVGEIHLAGHTVQKINDTEIRIDDHGSKVIEEVWSLFSFAIKYIGNRVPVMIEWDTDIPELSVLIDEMKKANAMMNKIITSSKKMSAA